MSQSKVRRDRRNFVDPYVYRVIWSASDRQYVALVEEMSSLSWLANTPEEALAGMRALMFEINGT